MEEKIPEKWDLQKKKKSSRNQQGVSSILDWIKAAPGKVKFLEDGQMTTTDRKSNYAEAGSWTSPRVNRGLGDIIFQLVSVNAPPECGLQ